MFSVAVGTFATPEGDWSEGWASAEQWSRLSSHPWNPRSQELVNQENSRFFQGGGQGLQKAGGSARSHQGRLTDVFSASASLLVLGRWAVGNQAAENLDPPRMAPFPRQKAEHFWRAATRSPQLQGTPRYSAPSRSPYNLGKQPGGAGRREHLAVATCILGHSIIIQTSHGHFFTWGNRRHLSRRTGAEGRGCHLCSDS